MSLNLCFVSSEKTTREEIALHVVARAIWNELEHLRELQRILAVIDLGGCEVNTDGFAHA